jgi:hypothetical protein
MTKLGAIIQSASPAFISSVALLLFVGVVALVAHFSRDKLPRALQQTWYRHHGAYKALGLFTLVIVVITIYSTGVQI